MTPDHPDNQYIYIQLIHIKIKSTFIAIQKQKCWKNVFVPPSEYFDMNVFPIDVSGVIEASGKNSSSLKSAVDEIISFLYFFKICSRTPPTNKILMKSLSVYPKF